MEEFRFWNTFVHPTKGPLTSVLNSWSRPVFKCAGTFCCGHLQWMNTFVRSSRKKWKIEDGKWQLKLTSSQSVAQMLIHKLKLQVSKSESVNCDHSQQENSLKTKDILARVNIASANWCSHHNLKNLHYDINPNIFKYFH